MTGFIVHLYTLFVSISNYYSITGLHILKITLTEAHMNKVFLVCCLHQSLPSSDFQRQMFPLLWVQGRAVAQAVSRWLPTAASRVRVRAACGVCGGQSAQGQVFSEYFGFPCQSFHQYLHYHNYPGLAQ
jgi:hypothetical protein